MMMLSRVRGFRPWWAARLFADKVPNPAMVTVSSLARVSRIGEKTALSDFFAASLDDAAGVATWGAMSDFFIRLSLMIWRIACPRRLVRDLRTEPSRASPHIGRCNQCRHGSVCDLEPPPVRGSVTTSLTARFGPFSHPPRRPPLRPRPIVTSGVERPSPPDNAACGGHRILVA